MLNSDIDIKNCWKVRLSLIRWNILHQKGKDFIEAVFSFEFSNDKTILENIDDFCMINKLSPIESVKHIPGKNLGFWQIYEREKGNITKEEIYGK